MKCITLDHVLPSAFDVASPGDVWGCHVTFERGERVMIEASSGSGKTSLCAFLMGMRRDFTGRILFDGNDTAVMSRTQWSDVRRRSLAWLQQDIGLFPQLSLRDNIVLKNSLTRFRAMQWIDDVCGQLGIGECLDKPAGRLSVGQQQRGALVRALCQPFDFLILDEPVSHLDSRWNEAVSALVDSELSSSGAGLIITSVGNRLGIKTDKTLSL